LILPLPVLLSVMMWTLNNILPTHVESTTTQPAKVPKALDVGCGSGREAILLATRGWEVWVRRWEDSHAGGKRDFFWTQMRVFVARRAMM
jgi:SAM-dependent methyltransferase